MRKPEEADRFQPFLHPNPSSTEARTYPQLSRQNLKRLKPLTKHELVNPKLRALKPRPSNQPETLTGGSVDGPKALLTSLRTVAEQVAGASV